MMQGEILVMEVMDRARRLKGWHARQQRDAEWAALKQWWKAEARVHAAADETELKAAVAHRSQTARLYHAELARAWPKWARVQRDRAARHRLASGSHPPAGRQSAGLPAQ